jgi:Tol biopolymer transport system component
MFERIRTPLSALFVLFVFAGCGSAEPTTAPTRTSTPATASPLSGPYLGQEPPGTTPKVFAPGVVSRPDSTEYSGTFSPDGKEYYFYRFSQDSPSTVLFSVVLDGEWTAPRQLPATAGHDASEPHLTLDNKRLYFAWDRPAPERQPDSLAGFGIYVVRRTRTGWSKPDFAGQGMFLSSSRDGQMYITDMSSRNSQGQTYLAKITLRRGLFAGYERLPIKTDWGSPAHPCIAPDGSYLLFDVQEGNYLYVSFLKADGTWGAAIDLTQHGFDPMAGGAYVSPDGKYLLFALRGDIWWVDAAVIEDLRPKE